MVEQSSGFTAAGVRCWKPSSAGPGPRALGADLGGQCALRGEKEFSGGHHCMGASRSCHQRQCRQASVTLAFFFSPGDRWKKAVYSVMPYRSWDIP